MNAMIYRKKGALFLFLIPSLIFMAVFLYYPFVMNIINSFLHITALGDKALGVNQPWYENYVKLFQDTLMGVALKNTFLMMLLPIVFQVGIALVLALLVDNIRFGTQFFRTAFFFPIVISASALGLMFNLVFLYDGGMINQLLQALHLQQANLPVDWKDKSHALATMFIPVCWQYVGFYFVILATGLNNISQELYEAAEIDGATKMQCIGHITLPLLRNTLCTCLVLAITGALKVFDLPWVMFPSGMPMDTTWLTGTYMYQQAWKLGDVDYSSTIAIEFVVLVVVLSQAASRVFKEKEY
ncbi:MAG: sugar ABC transporter permease [Clostridiales bacterium]|nr:sugar ABC transporter permease [Clostridiales bacterium]